MKKAKNLVIRTSFLYLLLAGVILTGCTSTSTGVLDKNITIPELKRKVNLNSFKISSIDAEGNISIETTEESNSGFMTLSIHKPDSLYMKIQGPFGISVATILLTRENFIYYNVLENKIIKGPSSPLNIGVIMRIKMDFDEIINAFSGSFVFSDMSDRNADLQILEDQYFLTENDGEVTRKYWISPIGHYVTKYEVVNNTTKKPKLSIEYTNYEDDGRFYFPKNVFASKPDDGQYVSLEYLTKEFNENRLNFKLIIPKNAQIVEWN